MAGTTATDANTTTIATLDDATSSTTQGPPNTAGSGAPTAVLEVLPTASLRPSLSWKTIRSSISISEKTSAQLGWAIAFLSVLFTIVTLSPAFKSQVVSEKALKLAEWTALKDYIEECREELAAGLQSQACLRAMKANLPPPPYVDGIGEAVRRSYINSTISRNVHSAHHTHSTAYVIELLLVLAILSTACVLIFLDAHRSRLTRRTRRDVVDEQDDPVSVPPITEVAANGTVRYPPPSSEAALRRRPVRTHPTYQHASLGDALHHADMTEIRSRLHNGEDVNEHWPYLIYRLAISPRTGTTERQLEVAQLCLDFGADVNALKGWNGQSALMIAIHFGNVNVARLLIVNGAMTCYASPDSNLTALHRCVRLAVTGSAVDALEIMHLLFKHGAKANQSNSLNETPLHNLLIDAWLARHDEQCVEKLYPIAICLLDNGASIPTTIKEKYTIGNPLWNVIYNAFYSSDWPEYVGPDSLDRFLLRKEEVENIRCRAMQRLRDHPFDVPGPRHDGDRNIMRTQPVFDRVTPPVFVGSVPFMTFHDMNY